MQWTAGPWESTISSSDSWEVPEGWIHQGHSWCPPGISLSSWLDFRGVPLSCWIQSSWSSCLLRQCSWPRSLPSRGSRTSNNFLISKECLVFGLAYSHVVLRPGYVPKVPTTPFHGQVVKLQALPSEEADPASALLCPVKDVPPDGGNGDIMSPCNNFKLWLVAMDKFLAPQRKTWRVDVPLTYLYPYARGVAQVCKIHQPIFTGIFIVFHWHFVLKSEVIRAPKWIP